MVCILFMTTCVTSKDMRVERSVTLVVVDSETGLPIPNITIYYCFRKVRPFMLIELKHVTIDIKMLKTNINGEITISAGRHFLRPLERFSTKSFFINIGIEGKEILDDDDFFKIDHFLIIETKKDNINFNNNIILIDDNYYATSVHIFDFKEKKESETFTNNFFWYQVETPFDEEIIITVRLVRNQSSNLLVELKEDNNEQGYYCRQQ